jgi:hypothetical protein
MNELNPNNTADSLAKNWFWIMDVIFGGIAILTFKYLFELFVEGTANIYVAICLLIFYLYHVGVYNFLKSKYPYKISFQSAFRYLIDFMMALLLFFILWTGIKYPLKEINILVYELTLWHLGAFGWHILANLEKSGKYFNKIMLPHLVFIVIYWIVFLALSYSHLNPSTIHLSLATCLLAVSLYRSYSMIINEIETSRNT